MYLTVVVVPDKAGGVELVDPSVHLVKVPLEAWVDILIPFTVEPNSFGVVVADELGELGIHEGIIRLPLPVLGTTRTLTRASDGIVVIAVPVEEGVIDVEAQTLLAALVTELGEDISLEGR